MTRLGWWAVTLAAVALVAAVVVLAISGGDGTEERGPKGERAAPSPATPPRPASRPRHRSSRADEVRREVHRAVDESPAPRLDRRQLNAASVVRAYVAALDRRDGARACRQFAPGALSSVDLPRRRAGCAGSLAASIGYRDPHGYPVYEGSRVARIASVWIDGRRARVVATTVTHFAKDREPSVEDDVVYLRRTGERWLISKPSAALYRAIGVGDIPPRALSPP